MSRKHFNEFAARCREHVAIGPKEPEAVRQRMCEARFAAETFASIACQLSASFNRTRFYAACGIDDWQVINTLSPEQNNG